RGGRLGGSLAVGLFVGITVWIAVAAFSPMGGDGVAAQRPIGFALLTIFVVTALVGGQPREADEEIANAIHEERGTARRTILMELGWLLIPAVVGTLAYLVVDQLPAVERAWTGLVSWSPGADLVPAGGAVWAIHGAVVAAAVGWMLRIVFTLIYGREAFGVGDIYILAAAGATAGWDIALLGLLFSVGIALVGWLLGLIFKKTGMIPFGPWLAIGFVLALWWNRPAREIAEVYTHGVRQLWRDQPQMLGVTGGLMLVASAAAVVFSRLVQLELWMGGYCVVGLAASSMYGCCCRLFCFTQCRTWVVKGPLVGTGALPVELPHSGAENRYTSVPEQLPAAFSPWLLRVVAMMTFVMSYVSN
ncbi:MAG: A24 family peptidase, partial [Rhodospirillales bacterium]|nr:A24 family peptidase [Rhodospirillales bacterium]